MMTWVELTAAVGLALATVREHKLRSFLTVLGVIIGTGTIIGVGSIIAGLNGAVTGVMRSFGTNTAVIFKAPIAFHRLTAEEARRKPLTYEDGLAIAARCPAVASVSPYLIPNTLGSGPQINTARYKGNEIYNPSISGTDEAYIQSGQVDIAEGRFFTEVENQHHMPVAVIGSDVPRGLFNGEDPIGKWIDVNGHKFEVVGVTKRPGNSFPGQDDISIYLPYFSMHKLFPESKENLLFVTAKPGELAAAIDEATAVLRIQRHVPANKPDNFSISTSDELVEQFHSVTAIVALVMVVMSSIGLLVGGIGVMNIMLVSVTERTREIGVRKAIGAKRADIVLQFLTEAVVLTGLGGLIGISMGWLVSFICRTVYPALPTAVPWWAAVLGVVVSMGIGLFFGIWPANKAASLDPVVALRYE
ncbi:MAG TPA: ABC transporter permease [Bryobacteraceae bacterium]|nr:ABC transporter permease [Bryobacteraceae bacterium]